MQLPSSLRFVPSRQALRMTARLRNSCSQSGGCGVLGAVFPSRLSGALSVGACVVLPLACYIVAGAASRSLPEPGTGGGSRGGRSCGRRRKGGGGGRSSRGASSSSSLLGGRPEAAGGFAVLGPRRWETPLSSQ
ncbi:hypothetical protein GDO81_005223 [Engystomops pustulosus]|uniref:Uncharacterized protein n=1 Tax=Engystomops pustulosus TaxID=76066 RepID=A0AAV7CNE1_ENGPU|nr:hypothetical protein GDO81_005223 [Engystomops pustulosus]